MYSSFVRDRITQLRLQHNLSEYQLSYALGQSRGYIQSITSGRTLPSMTMLFEICNYFQITPAEFFAADDPDPVFTHRTARKLQQLPERDRLLAEQLIDRLSQQVPAAAPPVRSAAGLFGTSD
ncbi:MAG: helix-turn-helix transcriptional regulator [Faecalibacterium sp.]|nr:helix-turn-helix transcriptional regulator [Faecalibacterium sp.]